MDMPMAGAHTELETEGIKTGVLIVEDEFIIAAALQRSLQRLGYSVEAVVDRADELEAVMHRHKPDLVLMDIEINGTVDGISAATLLRDRYDVPVVYVSGVIEEDILRRIPETQPFGFLAKPFTDRELSTAVSIAMYKFRTERRIRAQELQIQRLLEHMNQGFCLLDERGGVRYANINILKTLGCALEDIQNLPASSFLLDPERLEGFFSIFDSSRAPRRFGTKFRPEPAVTKIAYGGRVFVCYMIPQIISDPDSGYFQGCFLSIINIDDLESKTFRDVVE